MTIIAMIGIDATPSYIFSISSFTTSVDSIQKGRGLVIFIVDTYLNTEKYKRTTNLQYLNSLNFKDL